MSTRTNSLWRSIKDSLSSVTRIVSRQHSEVDIQALRSAANQARHLTRELDELVGHYEALAEIKRETER